MTRQWTAHLSELKQNHTSKAGFMADSWLNSLLTDVMFELANGTASDDYVMDRCMVVQPEVGLTAELLTERIREALHGLPVHISHEPSTDRTREMVCLRIEVRDIKKEWEELK